MNTSTTIASVRARTTATQAVGVVGFALATALGAKINLYVWEVPFTLQTLAVYGSGLYLGWRNGLLSQLLYLTLGMFLPVFAGDGYGLGYVAGAVSAGYLLAYPLASAATGYVSRERRTLLGSTLSMLAGSVIIFTCGVVWLHYAAGHATWLESLDKGFLRFVPVDLAKIVLLSLLYTGTRRLSGRES